MRCERRAQLQQRRFQFQKSAEQLVGVDDVTATGTVCVDNPAPPVCSDSAAITPRPACGAELVSDNLPISNGGHTVRLAISVQPNEIENAPPFRLPRKRRGAFKWTKLPL